MVCKRPFARADPVPPVSLVLQGGRPPSFCATRRAGFVSASLCCRGLGTALHEGRIEQARLRSRQLQTGAPVREQEKSTMSSPARMHESLVIGGGLAGAMAALQLARAGRDVVLLEKERSAHHKVCGEFLSPEAVESLCMAGIDPRRLGAVPIESLRLSAKRRVIQTPLPFRALSISRRVLDAVLLARAESAGCELRR